MPKFYVHSGQFHACLDKPTEMEAARHAIATAVQERVVTLGMLTHVSELGDDHCAEGHDDDLYVPTRDLLRQVGAGHKYLPQ